MAALGVHAARAAGQEDVWASRPTAAEVQAALPAAARTAGGRVVMGCKASPTGAVSDCALIHETPPAAGVGQAILTLAPRYRLKPEAVAKAAPDGKVAIVESFFRADRFPEWRHRPTPADLRTVWPADAWRRGIDGRATIDCLTSPTGSLYACVVVNESPAGMGFGGAVVALTPQFVMSPAMLNGQAVISDVTVPVVFKGAGGSSAAFTVQRMIPPAISWAEAPSLMDVAGAYPPEAKKAKVAGFVSLECSLKHDGHLRGCEVVREEPRGRGFAAAARGLTSLFRLDPAEFEGKPATGLSVNLPVVFDPAASDPAKGGKPIWTRLPDVQALHAAFASTKPATLKGHATLDCRVRQGGALEACAIDSETPADAGLGKTALALQGDFRLATWTDEGLPVVGRTVHVPLRFDQAAPPPPAPAAP